MHSVWLSLSLLYSICNREYKSGMTRPHYYNITARVQQKINDQYADKTRYNM